MSEPITLEVLAERIGGLSTLAEREFLAVQRQLTTLEGIPVKVEGLERDHRALVEKQAQQYGEVCKDIEELKESSKRGQEWRRGSLPMILITVVMALVALATLVQGIFH